METNRRKFIQTFGAGVAGLGLYPATASVFGDISGSTARASAGVVEGNPEHDVQQMLLELCDIAGYGIHSGIHPGPKADKAANYILDKLRAAGLTSARLDTVKVNDAFPKSFMMTASVEGEKPRPVSGFPLGWTVGTSPDGITEKLAYVGNGSKSDFELTDVKGKIALIDHVHFRHTSTASDGAVRTARDKGAIAVILAEIQVDGPKIKWQPGDPKNLFSIPGFSVGKSEGNYLKNLARSEKPYKIKYTLDVPHKVVDCYNVVAELPGNGSSEELLLVPTHYDCVFTGAIDNNASVALLIKWASYFASKPRADRNRDMMFAFCIGHDAYDGNSGHYQFQEKYKTRLNKAIVWGVDHAPGGTRYIEVDGELQPTKETSEIYTISNNYTFARIASFYLDKYGFINTIDAFRAMGSGPNWGIAPTNSPWVNSASITRYYHSSLDTPEKITLDQLKRAYNAHIEILETVDRLPGGFLRYDNLDKTRPNTPPKVRIAVLSDTVRAGDKVWAANDDMVFYDDKTCYRYPGIPYWASLKWDWGDGEITMGEGTPSTHIYTKPGNYMITMTLTDSEGATGTDTQQIKVLNPPS
ncbi:MAG: PKD domain-containing protein [Desulfobacteraceae bacterium]|jgi:hypothetical protein